MATIRVAANEEQSHSFFTSSSSLEEDSFAVLTLGAAHGLGAGKSRVRGNVREDLSLFTNRMVNLFSTHTVVDW